MKNTTKPTSSIRGITLLELSVVILVLMTLISVLFIGAKSYKNGADRTQCILNIRNVQIAVRSYQNMRFLNPGDELETTELISEDNGFLATLPVCPGAGDYTLATEIPVLGDLALDCSVNTGLEHEPTEHSNW